MSRPSMAAVAVAIAEKDLRIEWRSRVVINQVLPFSGLVMVMFALALDDDALLQRTAGGLVWLATVFSLFLIVQRAYAIDTQDSALDAMRVAGVDMQAMFLGKSLALAAQLLVLKSLLFVVAMVLYRVSLPREGVVLLVTTVITATIGFGFVGTLYGGLIAGAKGRDTLLPLLLLPVLAPVVLGATRATESALRSGGAVIAEGWPWVAVLVVFAGIFGVGGLLSFGALIEE
jgi:heme exporter protein B